MPSPTSRVPSFDLYRELEVDPDATTATIDAAWRSLVKRYHPDANPTIGSERIRRMNVAHDWLMDPALRTRYDAARGLRRPRPRRTKASAWAHTPAPPPLPIAPASAGTWSTSAKIAVYAGWCLASVVLAYIGSVVAAVVLSGANVTGIAAAFLGEDGALTLIQLLGNVLFAWALGYLVAASFTDAFDRQDDGTLGIVGTVAALAVTFGFPVFALSYLTGLAAWMATDGAGFQSIAVLSTIEAAFVGLVVAGTASVRRL